MLRRYLVLLTLAFCSLVSLPSQAEGEEAAAEPSFSYYTLSPDITTNVYTKGKKIGYLQVRVDLMVADNAYIVELEQHDPLIRDAIITIIGEQPEEKIRSLSGREDLRKKMLDQVNSLLLVETGKTIVAELLFTKYLYQ